MQLHYGEDDGLYWLTSSYEERETCKAAGFRWNPHQRRWETRDSYHARTLLRVATAATRAHLEALVAQQEATKALSRATTLDIELPVPDGHAYLPFQKAGIALASSRPSTLIADSMGLGKTVQALGVCNVLPTIRTVLVVCPATLKLNWRNEARAWLLPALAYELAVIDTKWSKEQLHTFFAEATETSRRLAIVNYDILHRFCTEIPFATAGTKKVSTLRFLDGYAVDQIIVDECHMIKHEKSRRSKAVRGVTATRKLCLSGTPIENRPIELFPILNYLDPLTWHNYFQFGTRFANAHQTDYGWNFSGSSHSAELHDILRSTVMIRRLKSDVLSELPPKIRQVIELPANGAASAVAAERRAYARHQARLLALRADVELAKADDNEAAYRGAVQALRHGARAAYTAMATVRHATALAKLPYVLEHLTACLEQEAKLIVFFWHHDVAHALAHALQAYQPALLTGEVTSVQHRQAAVERFQTDTACRVFLGSIGAAGVGITLTAASHVVFVELDWVPGRISQAEARPHRIGQTEPVLIQHLVLEGSLDATMARALVAKQTTIDAVLDTQAPFTVEEWEVPEVPVLATAPALEQHATCAVSRAQVARDAVDIAPDEIASVHAALQVLAGLCDGARRTDHMGFNMVDAQIGHALAAQPTLSPRQAVLGQKIIGKYHRQLALVEQ